MIVSHFIKIKKRVDKILFMNGVSVIKNNDRLSNNKILLISIFYFK